MTTTLGDIEDLTRRYAAARDTLGCAVQELEDEVAVIRRRRLPRIRQLVAAAAEARSRLSAAIELAPQLFQKPRTLVLHGVKVGFAKGKGRLEFADGQKVVELIRKHYPDRAEQLIQVRESPVKGALNQMTVAELKRIGVTVIESGDEVVIRPTDSEIDKLVEALLRDDPAEQAA
ncbi:host-nuclease inhibitor Gam family protein [Roseospirillum parvum]|uniref:Mu-like prophage host-nuclease inhibitor protein Gam n=1 Tax=Roseospirillum parvum TaxID=83401 RepID=A0A1G8G6C8_9PROT|nr:host-nuclease inhibitor Gam family protein [Roseospirillum parvum]SDH89939.1 hypothetical protein SAMN05421742_1205 [Roseospirillum parvum]